MLTALLVVVTSADLQNGQPFGLCIMARGVVMPDSAIQQV